MINKRDVQLLISYLHYDWHWFRQACDTVGTEYLRHSWRDFGISKKMVNLVKMDLTYWNSTAKMQRLLLCFNSALEKAVRNTKINLNGTRQNFAQADTTLTTSDYSFRSISTDGQ
jgi:hypothetical protein